MSNRKKQIEDAAEDACENWGEYKAGNMRSFINGAEWADANPLPIDRSLLQAELKIMMEQGLLPPPPAPTQDELTRIKFDIDQFIQAYAPDFFSEPEGFTPKLDMNSAAMVRYVLKKILTPEAEK